MMKTAKKELEQVLEVGRSKVVLMLVDVSQVELLVSQLKRCYCFVL